MNATLGRPENLTAVAVCGAPVSFLSLIHFWTTKPSIADNDSASMAVVVPSRPEF